MVDLHRIEMFHDPPMIKFFVTLIFPQSMLDVVVFDLVAPAIIKVVNFASYLTELFQIESLVNLREATFAEDR